MACYRTGPAVYGITDMENFQFGNFFWFKELVLNLKLFIQIRADIFPKKKRVSTLVLFLNVHSHLKEVFRCGFFTCSHKNFLTCHISSIFIFLSFSEKFSLPFFLFFRFSTFWKAHSSPFPLPHKVRDVLSFCFSFLFLMV